jgi:hypothetical protein
MSAPPKSVVASMDGLGVSAFIERDQVSIGIKNAELPRSPWLWRERSIRMNYRMALALSVETFDPLNLYPASRGFRDVAIVAGPEVDLDRAVGNDAVLTLGYVDPCEAKLRTEEGDASLDVKRCEDRGGGDELGRRLHGCWCGAWPARRRISLSALRAK